SRQSPAGSGRLGGGSWFLLRVVHRSLTRGASPGAVRYSDRGEALVACGDCKMLRSLDEIKTCDRMRTLEQMANDAEVPSCRLAHIARQAQTLIQAGKEVTILLDLATSAGKIEEADRLLQQEAVEAARAINEREKDVFAFCRRLIAVVRVVLD